MILRHFINTEIFYNDRSFVLLLFYSLWAPLFICCMFHEVSLKGFFEWWWKWYTNTILYFVMMFSIYFQIILFPVVFRISPRVWHRYKEWLRISMIKPQILLQIMWPCHDRFFKDWKISTQGRLQNNTVPCKKLQHFNPIPDGGGSAQLPLAMQISFKTLKMAMK